MLRHPTLVNKYIIVVNFDNMYSSKSAVFIAQQHNCFLF